MVVATDTCPWCGGTVPHEQFVAIQARIREEEKRRAVAAEAVLRKKLEEHFSQELQGQRQADKLALAQVEEKLKTLQTRAEQNIKALQVQAEQQRLKELNDQRTALEKHRDELLQKQRVEFGRERDRLQKKVMELDRQIQRKTAQELGDGAEIDLFEALKEEFPADRITRIPKGEPGGDILQEVMHKGEPCGRILIDSKSRQSWQYAFVTKLRQDQVETKAEHAILATTVFPSGKKELCIESDVIVVNPARAVHVVRLLRTATVALHMRGLSVKDRTTKMQRLYQFMTSEAYAKRVGEAGRLTQDILELDVEEKRAHDNVWKRRGALATRMSHVLREVQTDIAAIVEAEGTTAVSVA